MKVAKVALVILKIHLHALRQVEHVLPDDVPRQRALRAAVGSSDGADADPNVECRRGRSGLAGWKELRQGHIEGEQGDEDHPKGRRRRRESRAGGSVHRRAEGNAAAIRSAFMAVIDRVENKVDEWVREIES